MGDIETRLLAINEDMARKLPSATAATCADGATMISGLRSTISKLMRDIRQKEAENELLRDALREAVLAAPTAADTPTEDKPDQP